MKRSPLNKQSAKRKSITVERQRLVKVLKEAYVTCQACMIWASFDIMNNSATSVIVNERPIDDIHEIVNRSQGGSILDYSNLIGVCRKCHSRITISPIDGYLTGLHLPSYANDEDSLNESRYLRLAWLAGAPFTPTWMV